MSLKNISIAEGEDAFSLDVTVEPVSLIFVTCGLVGQCSFPVLLPISVLSFVEGALKFVDFNTAAMLDEVVNRDFLGSLVTLFHLGQGHTDILDPHTLEGDFFHAGKCRRLLTSALFILYHLAAFKRIY